MLIAYFDEVKHQAGRSPFYFLGAIVADATAIWNLEKAVNDLAEEVFGARTLSKDTEFHASALINGHHHFKEWDLPRRVEVLKKMVSIFGSEPDKFARVIVTMDTTKMLPGADVEGMAFMFLCERVDQYLHAKKSQGLLIGDRENETIAGTFSESLSHYRTWRTKYKFGQELKYLLDTVHFTHSHHSRMLQLADLHTWLRQLVSAGAHGKWHRQAIIDHVGSINDCLFPNKYKDWPTADSWTKV